MPKPKSPATVPKILAALRRQGSRRNRDGMARFAIVSPKAFGVPVPAIRAMAKEIGRDHTLALELWNSGWLEARI